MSRDARLKRWVDLLAWRPGRGLRTLHEADCLWPSSRDGARADESRHLGCVQRP